VACEKDVKGTWHEKQPFRRLPKPPRPPSETPPTCRHRQKWRDADSNWGHQDFQSCALPTELSRQSPARRPFCVSWPAAVLLLWAHPSAQTESPRLLKAWTWPQPYPFGTGRRALPASAMVAPERTPLTGEVEIDELYLGGPRGRTQACASAARRRCGVAIEVRNQGSGRLRLDILRRGTITDWIERSGYAGRVSGAGGFEGAGVASALS
jgi:hypothetical protein